MRISLLLLPFVLACSSAPKNSSRDPAGTAGSVRECSSADLKAMELSARKSYEAAVKKAGGISKKKAYRVPVSGLPLVIEATALALTDSKCRLGSDQFSYNGYATAVLNRLETTYVGKEKNPLEYGPTAPSVYVQLGRRLIEDPRASVAVLSFGLSPYMNSQDYSSGLTAQDRDRLEARLLGFIRDQGLRLTHSEVSDISQFPHVVDLPNRDQIFRAILRLTDEAAGSSESFGSGSGVLQDHMQLWSASSMTYDLAVPRGAPSPAVVIEASRQFASPVIAGRFQKDLEIRGSYTNSLEQFANRLLWISTQEPNSLSPGQFQEIVDNILKTSFADPKYSWSGSYSKIDGRPTSRADIVTFVLGAIEVKKVLNEKTTDQILAVLALGGHHKEYPNRGQVDLGDGNVKDVSVLDLADQIVAGWGSRLPRVQTIKNTIAQFRAAPPQPNYLEER